tara:strand:+ start:127 stop:741 length:615 start_codon:yes stop_codon:yes gene_type:complete
MAEEKLKGKPRTVSAATRAGEKYFYDKNGTKKLAVTKEALKKSGKTLKQWANDWKKPSSKSKDTAVKKSLRPKTRSRGFAAPSVTVTLLADKYMDEKPRSSDRGKANRNISRKRKPGGPDPSGLMTPGGRKTYVPIPKVKKTSGKSSKLRGADWMKAHTYADYMALSKAEARALGLPPTRIDAMKRTSTLRNQKFKDGKNFMGK